LIFVKRGPRPDVVIAANDEKREAKKRRRKSRQHIVSLRAFAPLRENLISRSGAKEETEGERPALNFVVNSK
jgi:hypothetical protein